MKYLLEFDIPSLHCPSLMSIKIWLVTVTTGLNIAQESSGPELNTESTSTKTDTSVERIQLFFFAVINASKNQPISRT